MTMKLSGRVFLDVSADGAVFIRERGQPIGKGLLPLYTVDTIEEAESLRVFHCHLARDGSGVYRLNNWPGDDQVECVDALDAYAEQFTATLARWRKRQL